MIDILMKKIRANIGEILTLNIKTPYNKKSNIFWRFKRSYLWINKTNLLKYLLNLLFFILMNY